VITTLARAKFENANNLKEISVASFKHGYVKVGEVQPDPNDEFKGFEYVKEK